MKCLKICDTSLANHCSTCHGTLRLWSTRAPGIGRRKGMEVYAFRIMIPLSYRCQASIASPKRTTGPTASSRNCVKPLSGLWWCDTRKFAIPMTVEEINSPSGDLITSRIETFSTTSSGTILWWNCCGSRSIRRKCRYSLGVVLIV